MQCAIFSPAKQGIIKEIVTPTKIGRAVGVVEVTAIASMLVGGLAGGALYDLCSAPSTTRGMRRRGDDGGIDRAGAGVAGGRLPDSAHLRPHQPAVPRRTVVGALRAIARCLAQPPVRLCVLGISYFYGLAGALYLTLFEVSASIHLNGTGTALQTGVYAATLGVGIICGSFLVTRLTTHQVEIGLIPIGSCGLIGGAMLAGVSDPRGPIFLAALFGMGLAGALFVVPLNAHLQEQVEPSQRGRILSANNLFVNLFGIVAVIIQYIVSAEFGVSPHRQLLLYALPTMAVTVFIIFLTPEGLLRLALGLLGPRFLPGHAGRVEGLPATGGVLLLPNHISYIDAVVLQLACPRPIRFLIYDEIYQSRPLRWGLRLLGAIPISPKKARAAIETAVDALAKGEVVCLFPEGALTRTATLQKLNRGYEIIARKARVPVMPVWLENVFGSVFSYYGGHFFWKMPRLVPLKVWIYFGAPMMATDATVETVRRCLHDLSEARFPGAARTALPSRLRKHPRLAQTILHARHHRRLCREPQLEGRPASRRRHRPLEMAARPTCRKSGSASCFRRALGATIANLGVVLANKIPVNLNFTAGRAANESAIAQAGIRRLITAPAMVEQIEGFSLAGKPHRLAALLKSFRPKSL